MANVKFTKNALREQEQHLKQLMRYLPTLQLKKAMLQAEVAAAVELHRHLKREHADAINEAMSFSKLLTFHSSVDPLDAVHIESIERDYENIAGVDVPSLKKIHFTQLDYILLDTPPWIDSVIKKLQEAVTKKIEVDIAQEKKAALEAELREVSIRVNLFEKVLIPNTQKNIRKIKVFLGDQELAAVSRAKVAKTKIEKRKLEGEGA